MIQLKVKYLQNWDNTSPL